MTAVIPHRCRENRCWKCWDYISFRPYVDQDQELKTRSIVNMTPRMNENLWINFWMKMKALMKMSVSTQSGFSDCNCNRLYPISISLMYLLSNPGRTKRVHNCFIFFLGKCNSLAWFPQHCRAFLFFWPFPSADAFMRSWWECRRELSHLKALKTLDWQVWSLMF